MDLTRSVTGAICLSSQAVALRGLERARTPLSSFDDLAAWLSFRSPPPHADEHAVNTCFRCVPKIGELNSPQIVTRVSTILCLATIGLRMVAKYVDERHPDNYPKNGETESQRNGPIRHQAQYQIQPPTAWFLLPSVCAALDMPTETTECVEEDQTRDKCKGKNGLESRADNQNSERQNEQERRTGEPRSTLIPFFLLYA
jgi:hypothetical protein